MKMKWNAILISLDFDLLASTKQKWSDIIVGSEEKFEALETNQ